ncbi:MAG: hypothetical protein J5662_03660 [Clostridia bacterium]|nr:hypothetical protein [Clostridia bacterium]
MINYKKHSVNILVLLLVTLMLLTSCRNEKKPVKSNTSGKNSSQMDGNTSSNNEQDTESSDDVHTQSNNMTGYSLNGDYSVKISLSRPADDANEYRVSGNCAVLNTNYAGYADAQAEALRKEILNTKNTTDIYKIKGQCYYISPNGDNNNDGKTPKTALRTTDGIDGVDLERGDAILFERNSIFRITRAISPQEGITYGSYGKGDKPKIYACAENYANRNLWQPSNKKNVWKTEFSYGEVGDIVFNHGEMIGYWKRNGIDQLEKNTQYYHNKVDGITYLYCDKGNPGDVYKDIEICPDYNIFDIPKFVDNVTIDNLCLKYSSHGAVSGAYKNKNIVITNCEIGYIGGYAGASGGVRQGNAVQIWASTENMIADHNWIYQTFDTAISPQGGGDGAVYTNISFCNNLLEYNSVDFEWFDRAGTLFDGIKCDGNIMRFTSLGWGNRVDDAGVRGIEGCIRANTCEQTFKNFSFKNNIIDCPGRQIINWTLDIPQLDEINAGYNKVFINATYRKIFSSNPAILRGLHETGTSNAEINATNQSELETIWKYFDKSSSSAVKWYD